MQFTRILSTKQLRQLEAEWIKSTNQPWGLVLMEVAGMGAAEVAASMFSGSGAGVTVVCGAGNNGGDGFVVARHLQRWGFPVQVFTVGTNKPGTEGDTNRALLLSTGVQITALENETTEYFAASLRSSDLIVDALLGTGLDRNVEGTYADAIDWINASGQAVLAIDIPSGINSDTGAIMGTAVEADATVTFGHLKAGLLHHPGAEHAGDLVLIDIGLPESHTTGADWHVATHQQIAEWLPSRRTDANKGTMGRLLCVAGSYHMHGAAMLAARASLRTGVGITVLATAQTIVPSLPAEEIIYHPLPQTEAGSIAHSAGIALASQVESASALLIGPGLSTNKDTVKFVQEFVKNLSKPAIIDADALNAIAENSKLKPGNAAEVVLTPHPKELSRLTGMSVADIQADRIAAAEKARDQFGCNIVLKGAHTVVATIDGTTWIIPCGNPGMATAGSGDVLSGIIGALLAQGVHAPHAAVAGAYLHAAAGDLAAFTHGEDGMVASSITEALPMVLADIRSGEYAGTELEEMLLAM